MDDELNDPREYAALGMERLAEGIASTIEGDTERAVLCFECAQAWGDLVEELARVQPQPRSRPVVYNFYAPVMGCGAASPAVAEALRKAVVGVDSRVKP